MRIIFLPIYIALLVSFNTFGQGWRDECVGYYQLQLPANLEVALYPINSFTHPRKEHWEEVDVITKRYRTPVITFGVDLYESGEDRVQAQFTQFYYSKYKIAISSRNTDLIDFNAYKKKVEDDYQFTAVSKRLLEKRDFEIMGKPVTDEEEFKRRYGFTIRDYNNAFVVYDFLGYSIQINSAQRLYHFWGRKDKYTDDKRQTSENQWRENEPEVKSLLNRFSPREIYEVPTKKGFCIPYGFIAEDSGKVPHNMAVTYRLIDNPDITIFIQDLGMTPESAKEDKLSPKEYVTWLWNWQYQWSAISKELIRPKWRTIEMAGRKGLGTFAKAEFKDGRTDYGYVAYVRGDHNARNVDPDLLVYVMQYSVQAKNRTPMDKKDLEKMAERIVASVKRR